MLRFLSGIFCLFMAFLLRAEEVYLFQTTDLHGKVYESQKNTAAPSLLAALSEDASRVGRDRALLIDCGDLLQGSLESSDDGGKTMIRLLNSAKFDVWIPGNHDFEFGRAVFARRVNEFKGTVLAANLKFPSVKPYRIFTRNGIRIAVVGMTSPHLGQWLFRPEKEGFLISSVETAYRQILPRIRKENPDLIIMGIHSGIYPSKRLGDQGLFVFAGRHPEVKVILGGHTHETVICKELGRSGVCYFQAGFHGKGYLRIKLRFDGSTRRLHEVRGEFVPAVARKHLPAVFRVEKQQYPLICRTFPVNAGEEAVASIFSRAILKGFPNVKGVFHGKLTTFRPRYPRLSRLHLFQLCPFENRVLLAKLSKSEFEAVLKEQKNMAKSGMKQYFKSRFAGEEIWNASPDHRYLFAFNSYAASGAGGRFPVLKKIIESPSAEAVLTDKRIFDLLESYVKEVYK